MNIEEIVKMAEANIQPQFAQISDIVQHNTAKVLAAFRDNRVSTAHLSGTNGYGYDDAGREVCDKVFAQVFGAEDALVRYNFVSGTHAISTALRAILRPGDTLVYLNKPYDTLHSVIKYLKTFGIEYVEIADYCQLSTVNCQLLCIQKSRGYEWERESLSNQQIGEIIAEIKRISPETIVLVDNCYGEFVEKTEPTNNEQVTTNNYGLFAYASSFKKSYKIKEFRKKFYNSYSLFVIRCSLKSASADLVVGSLIKNPGGGICQTGGYIAGKRDLIEKCAESLTAAGLGKQTGATLNANREILQGLFVAPHAVGEALKTAAFAGELFRLAGFEVRPVNSRQLAVGSNKHWKKTSENNIQLSTVNCQLSTKSDIVTAIKLGTSEKLLAFCAGIQSASPIDSHLTPTPWAMPGYAIDVVMAGGTFVQGSTLELSADSAMREPFVAYLQGGLTYESAKIAVVEALKNILEV